MSFYNIPQGNTNSANAGGALLGSNAANATGTTNPPSAFGSAFGTPSGGNIFGGGGASTTTSGSLFGGGNTTASGTPASIGGGLFGGGANTSASTTTPATTGGGLFGAATNNAAKPATGALGGGLFGGASTSNPSSTPATGLFGGASTPATNTTGNLFGGGAASTTPAGNLFGGGSGVNTAAGTTPSTNPNPLFGGAFNLPKPAENASNATKPAGSSFFNQPSTGSNVAGASTSTGTAVAANNTAAPATGSSLFGLPAKPSTTPANGSSTGATANLFGGGLFGQAASSSATQPAAGASSTPATGGGLFGNSNVNKEKDLEKKDGEKKDATPAAAPAAGFNLFGGAKAAEKKDEAGASKDGDKKDTTAVATGALPSSGTASNTTSALAIPPPSMLRGKSLEEIINRWTADLEHNVREFNKFAAEVSIWDRALIENGNNIAALFNHLQAAERHQNSINESLEHIEQQQKDLGSTLDAYEKASQDILGGQSGSLRSLDTGPADNERDKNYMLATDLHTHLDDLSGSLTQMIGSVNALSISSKPPDSADDPMSQIAQILSSHLESLQWIDTAVREVENKTVDVERRIKESGHSISGGGSKSRGFGMNR